MEQHQVAGLHSQQRLNPKRTVFFQNVYFFNVIPHKCKISAWSWSMHIFSSLWILMTPCLAPGHPSVATVLSMHPCISNCSWVKLHTAATKGKKFEVARHGNDRKSNHLLTLGWWLVHSKAKYATFAYYIFKGISLPEGLITWTPDILP